VQVARAQEAESAQKELEAQLAKQAAEAQVGFALLRSYCSIRVYGICMQVSAPGKGLGCQPPRIFVATKVLLSKHCLLESD
jgi:hypothetical protein